MLSRASPVRCPGARQGKKPVFHAAETFFLNAPHSACADFFPILLRGIIQFEAETLVATGRLLARGTRDIEKSRDRSRVSRVVFVVVRQDQTSVGGGAPASRKEATAAH